MKSSTMVAANVFVLLNSIVRDSVKCSTGKLANVFASKMVSAPKKAKS